MGKLYKRGTTYYADYLDREGNRQRVSTRTSDPVIARARLREFELATTDSAPHQTETLNVALTYFVDIVCAGKPAGTVRCYQQKGRHLSRLMGESLLDKLQRQDVERYIAERLGEGAHTHSVHKELVVLRGTLKSAAIRDRFHRGDIVPRFESGYTPRTVYMTPEQFIAMVPCLVPPLPKQAKPRTLARREARMQSRALYCLLIAYASPRRGELEALRWEHVDLSHGIIQIPKGKTVGRPIKIHPVLRPWLEAMHRGSGFVVEPWSNVGRDLPAACARAGVPRCTPNDLRRTFASWMVQAGVSNRIVAKLLGHSSTRMVDLVYGHLDDATLTAAIMRLPGCDAGVTRSVPFNGTPGTGGTTQPTCSIVNSVEQSADSACCGVPREGYEPPTRGFSVLMDLVPKRVQSRPILRAVK